MIMLVFSSGGLLMSKKTSLTHRSYEFSGGSDGRGRQSHMHEILNSHSRFNQTTSLDNSTSTLGYGVGVVE